MMKNKFLLPVVLFAGLMMLNFLTLQVYGQTPQTTPAKQQAITYMCPMHPEIVKNEPGKCPNCGMTMVEKKKMHQTNDSTMKKNDKMKMMHDTTMMKKGQMKQDTIR